jgi:hypothetical protein
MAPPPPSGPGFTGLVIPASPVPAGLEAFRRRHVHHPGVAVPFHTTLVRPWLPLEGVDLEARERLRRVAARLAPFDYAAGSICCFPTSFALWLAPSPVAPFEACAEAIYEAFPAMRPDGGFPSTFHLTIGLGRSADDLPEMLREFRDAFGPRMPLRLRARHLDLYAEADGRFRRLDRFTLGG